MLQIPTLWPPSSATGDPFFRVREAATAGLRAAKRSGPVTLRQHLEEVDPGQHLDWWHVGAMIERGQALLDGEIPRLIISAPPRTYKSRTVVQGLTSCRMRTEPRAKTMVACASIDLVNYHSRHARDWSIRAGLELRHDSQSVSLWETRAGGTYFATTILGGQLGFGWDGLVTDDPFASMDAAQSRTIQLRTWDRWRDDLQQRAQDRPEGGPPWQLLMHQRLARGDVVGRLIDWLEEAGAEEWHALILDGFRDPKPFSLPPCVHLLPDSRKPGEPLCDDEGVMREITRRRETNSRLHMAIDQQRPMQDEGGGIFRASWLPILDGAELDEPPDLGKPVEAILALYAGGEIAKPKRWLRGHDFTGGGSDAVASVGLCQLEPGQGLEWILFDPTEDHPPAAGVEGVVLRNASRQGSAVEQAIPAETGVGKTLTARVAGLLRERGKVVRTLGVGRGKRALAMPLAADAAPSCRICARLIVEPSERVALDAEDLCSCDEPSVRPGRVAILAGPLAGRLQAVLHDFDGEEGGDDDLVDAACIARNAAAGGVVDEVHWGRVPHWSG